MNGNDSLFSKQMKEFGLHARRFVRNASAEVLHETATKAGECINTSTGAVAVQTCYTGRSPDDKFIVYDDITKDAIHWNEINHRFSSQNFDGILEKMKKFAEGKDLYVFDGFVGADRQNGLPIRIINDHAWQSMFASRMFIRPTADELATHKPEFTAFCLIDYKAQPEVDGTNSEVFILMDMSRRIILIGGTDYAGEIKKSIFTAMNFLLPPRNVFPMHCSANTNSDGHVALFFGLSGTGKTTLSADDGRMLIGDDEHGWSDEGVFNFEGGCYAKCINLSEKNEPQIWNAIRKGAILENVVIGQDGKPSYGDSSATENTRVAYPLDHIPNAVCPSLGGHPSVVIFLTADAKGVLPPISKLTKEGAMYHFMSGYTSKLAGTERNVKKPRSVFSECFGAPFMPRSPQDYARMLAKKITRHETDVYLINTGWSGGAYGTGHRIELAYSRAMVKAALSGELKNVQYSKNAIFNLDIPLSCPGVPSSILDPKNTWADPEAYTTQAKQLAEKFIENFAAKFGDAPPEIIAAGPRS